MSPRSFRTLCLALLAGAWLLGSLEACNPPPQRRYYVLAYPLPSAEDVANVATHPATLRVRPFNVALAYDRPQIVYRQSPFEFNYYTFRLWSAKPQKMVREVLARHLQAARVVEEVVLEIGERPPAYELGGELLAIEEYDAGDVWFAHLSMRLWLARYSNKQIVWTHFFDVTKKVYHKDPVHVVRGLSQILEAEVIKVVAGIDATLAGRPAPAAGPAAADTQPAPAAPPAAVPEAAP